MRKTPATNTPATKTKVVQPKVVTAKVVTAKVVTPRVPKPKNDSATDEKERQYLNRIQILESDQRQLKEEQMKMSVAAALHEKELGWEQFDLKILRQDIDLYLESDPELVALEMKLTVQKEKTDYLQSFLKELANRQYHIRDAILWRKFISGVN